MWSCRTASRLVDFALKCSIARYHWLKLRKQRGSRNPPSRNLASFSVRSQVGHCGPWEVNQLGCGCYCECTTAPDHMPRQNRVVAARPGTFSTTRSATSTAHRRQIKPTHPPRQSGLASRPDRDTSGPPGALRGQFIQRLSAWQTQASQQIQTERYTYYVRDGAVDKRVLRDGSGARAADGDDTAGERAGSLRDGHLPRERRRRVQPRDGHVPVLPVHDLERLLVLRKGQRQVPVRGRPPHMPYVHIYVFQLASPCH